MQHEMKLLKQFHCSFKQKLFECTKEELKLLKEQASLERQSCDENKKNFQDMKYTTSRQIQDVEKRYLEYVMKILPQIFGQSRT